MHTYLAAFNVLRPRYATQLNAKNEKTIRKKNEKKWKTILLKWKKKKLEEGDAENALFNSWIKTERISFAWL